MGVRWRGKKGQGIAAEYAILLTLVIAAIGGITVYVKRAYQGRIRDAGISMMGRVANVVGTSANVHYEYEPYYVDSITDTDESSADGVAAGGTYRRIFETNRSSNGVSYQLPPKDAD